ncbi:unnamed protein product [Camellia sinensis]
MERYSQSDPAPEWRSPGDETGLQEPMWQLGLGGGEESYPERPDEADCIYYLRTGFCGYGSRCRFNHPRDRGSAVGALRTGGGEHPERVGQPICQYYMRTGMCKFGASCKYHHPRQGSGSAIHVAVNMFGYPLRPGEKECSYYVKTGQCKFGVTCKFHHPPPAGIQVPAPTAGPLPVPPPVHAPGIYPSMPSPSVPSSQPYGMVTGNWQVARPTLVPGFQGAYSHVLLPPGMVPLSGWNPYQVSAVPSPSTQSTVGAAPVYGMTQLSPSAPAYTGGYLPYPSPAGPSNNSQKEHTFPERPDQPECQYYMKTGHCKFGSSCRYHHPPEWSTPKINFALSPMGLPLRPAGHSSKIVVQWVELFWESSTSQLNLGCHLVENGDASFIVLPSLECPFFDNKNDLTICIFEHLVQMKPVQWLSGAPLCTHYAQNGVCRFGPSCKFDHPMGTLSYSPSTSSLADMPVAPYPVGSSKGTLAPSSSSSELRPEFMSGSHKDAPALSTRMSSSMSSSSGSVSSVFSKSGSTSHQASAPSAASSSMSQGGEGFILGKKRETSEIPNKALDQLPYMGF